MSFLKRSKPFQDVPRFGNLSKEEMQRVVDAGRAVHVPKGWSLLNESTPPDQAYLVIDGTLEVRHHGKRVAELGRGDIVGEIAITAHRLRTGTVTALEPLEMLNLSARRLPGAVRRHPGLPRGGRQDRRGAARRAGRRRHRLARPPHDGRPTRGTSSAWRRSCSAAPGSTRAPRLPSAPAYPSRGPNGFGAPSGSPAPPTTRWCSATPTWRRSPPSTRSSSRGSSSPRARTRSPGRSGRWMARLADWQTSLMSGFGDGDDVLEGGCRGSIGSWCRRSSKLQAYVWRRHLVAAAGRILPVAADNPDVRHHGRRLRGHRRASHR